MNEFDVSKDEELLKLKNLSEEEINNIVNQISVTDLEDLMAILNGGTNNE